MKKTIALLLAVLTVLSLAACGSKGGATQSLDLAKASEAVAALEYFPNPMEMDDETLKTAYGIDPALVQQKLIIVPMMNVHASMLWLLLPAEGKTEEVKTAMDTYLTSYQAMWDSYLPDQAELVRNRLATEIETKEGTWLVYSISEDNEKVVEAVKSALA